MKPPQVPQPRGIAGTTWVRGLRPSRGAIWKFRPTTGRTDTRPVVKSLCRQSFSARFGEESSEERIYVKTSFVKIGTSLKLKLLCDSKMYRA
ncbi:unnamed protein product [Amoebophrya sp. A120]|nr:unnamed protein product [Amoebophrya sp. A120]|eukprot:GSA120T00004917001.1